MARMYQFETDWGRDVGLAVLIWLVAITIATVLLLTVVRAFFV